MDLVSTLQELNALDVGFVSLCEALDLTTPSGRALAGMLAVFAEFEREILRDRVKHGATVVMTTHDMDEVEKICDRVGIVCRGKLVALDSPLALKQAHTERKVDIACADGERFVFDMDSDAGRRSLAELLTTGRVATMRTREFDFHATFLKLTGLEFS